jgi:hypothetical protein
LFDIEPNDDWSKLESSVKTVTLNGIVMEGSLIQEMLSTRVKERAVILYRLAQLDKNGDGTTSEAEIENFQKKVQAKL